MKYVALLRGINVGGNNKVAMSELRDCFERLGFSNVSTYINSGNLFFACDETDIAALIHKCEVAIEDRFGFIVVATVISKDDFEDALDHAPGWWADGTQGMRNDALFVIAPTTAKEVLTELQKKTSTVDKLDSYGQVVFWTLPMADYNKSVVPKIIGTPIYRRITMRSSTTVKRLLGLF
ncbi:DUF1697 domain-containing protein [Candidatus Saccharibacteria bacterium]|nr:DUF1697 domain-containing protein [Candidatus Saccharibacteria bacterium]